jgi:outer membrane receptor protein involved in Fe transport
MRLFTGLAALAVSAPGFAQDAAADPPRGESRAASLDEVVVVGSRVRQGVEPGASPVTLITGERIEEYASSTADEILRALPQNANVSFNSEQTGVNDARGDVASVNLRGLGSGNTLILLNGRRLVNHPATQTENDVPIVIVNANTLPTLGLQRLEVLRDGAGALYGSDAVAGVLNTVTRRDFDGFQMRLRYGGSQHTDLDERTATVLGGWNFNGGATNVSLFGTYFDRNGMPSADRDYARSSDLRPLAPAGWEGDTDLNNTSQSSPWGEFNTRNAAGTAGVRVRQGTTNVTTTGGRFHVQPTVLDPGVPTAYGTEIRSGSLNAALREDLNRGVRMTPDAERWNGFATFVHRLESNVEIFGEAGLYTARTEGLRAPNPVDTADAVTIPAGNFWNPFGPAGSPNRLPNLNPADVPAAGLNIDWRRFRFNDTGRRTIRVESDSWRGLVGVRGKWSDWDWETAGLYSAAGNEDHENRISKSLLQAALARTDSSAYNPFLGLAGANSTALAEEITVDFVRESDTSLALWDARLSNPEALRLPVFGALGAAVGVEWRRETYDENRDSRVDGTIIFTDSVSGASSGSDIIGSSPTPDSDGDRDVHSVYVEGVAQLVEPERGLPLMHDLELQLAARYESYSDFGDVTKPKIALAWRPWRSLLVRGSYSEGFRAPNLIQLFEGTIRRFDDGRDDLYRSRVTGSTDDSNRTVIDERRSNPDLQPEDSEAFAYGLVFDPPFVEGLRIAADFWRIEQEGTIGLFGDVNHIRLDDVLRRQGSFNPAVLREAPTAADVAAYQAYNLANGTNFAPAGEIIRVSQSYLNLDPRVASGFDASIAYASPRTRFGSFELELNTAYLIKLEQSASGPAQALLDDPLTDPDGATIGGLIERSAANPRWKGNARLGWSFEPWRAGVSAEYVGRVYDESLNQDAGEARPASFYRVEDSLTVDAYAEYDFDGAAGLLNGLRVRVGGRNLFDEDPPFADETFGYISSLHNNRGRFLYIDVRLDL